MSNKTQTIKVKIKCRHGDDPKLALAAVQQTLAKNRSRPLEVEIDLNPQDSKKTNLTPNEPAETEAAKKANDHLKMKIRTLRENGQDPDIRKAASVKMRVEKRDRVSRFSKWCTDKVGGASIVVLVKGAWEAVKSL